MTPPPPAALRFARPVTQARAERSTRAIVAALLDLLRERDYDDIPVAELAQKAGLSVGGFYARFASKDALLPVVAEHLLIDCRTALDDAMDAAVTADGTDPSTEMAGIIRAYVEAMVRKFRQHRRALIQVRRHAADGDPRIAATISEFNTHAHGRLRTLLQERRAVIGHPDPDLAIELGLFMASAAAREAVLAGSLRVYRARVDDEQLATEITRSYVAFLDVAPAPRPKRRRQ